MGAFRKRAVWAVSAWLGVCGVAVAAPINIVVNSGTNIKDELFRADNSTTTWDPITFTISLPQTAVGNGVFNLFAGGDLNNLAIDRIQVTAGSTVLGSFAFPADITNLGLCEQPVHTNPDACPVPETVPGGDFQDLTRGPGVGNIQGRRDVTASDAGFAGLVIPQALLLGGTDLLISLLPTNDVFDVYFDRIEISYTSAAAQVPEPATWYLLLAGLAALGIGAKRRGA